MARQVRGDDVFIQHLDDIVFHLSRKGRQGVEALRIFEYLSQLCPMV